MCVCVCVGAAALIHLIPTAILSNWTERHSPKCTYFLKMNQIQLCLCERVEGWPPVQIILTEGRKQVEGTMKTQFPKREGQCRRGGMLSARENVSKCEWSRQRERERRLMSECVCVCLCSGNSDELWPLARSSHCARGGQRSHGKRLSSDREIKHTLTC